jgi:DNA processing protein
VKALDEPPPWALSVSVDPSAAGAVAGVLAVVAGGAIGPHPLRRVLATRLERGVSTRPADVLAELERSVPPRLDESPPERIAQALAAHGARVLVAGTLGYPERLAALWPELGAPLWLFLRSERPLPTAPAVAIVGSRLPTADGVHTATELARLLARSGVVVVSGMARGIDEAAHRGALGAGGESIGVLGTGFGVDYPSGRASLREALASSGGLVTELPPGAGPRPAHFIWRNRIISSLADAVVVVEGRERSGALVTARLAAAQGRDVWAVPGSINQPTSRAPLELLRDGARPLTRIDDVLEGLGLPSPAPAASEEDGSPDGAASPEGVSPGGSEWQAGERSGDVARRVAAALSAVPASAGALTTATSLPLPTVLAALASLESAGTARTTPRGWVAAP